MATLGVPMLSRISSCNPAVAHVVRLSRRFPLSLLIATLLATMCYPAVAQENYLVGTQDGKLSLYDLATNSLITSIKGGTGAVPGPNNRLAFAPNQDYLSVVDTTVQREVARLDGVSGTAAALTPDGKLLLVSGWDGVLRVVDTASFTLVRKVNLVALMGAYPMGSVVIAANKAYVFPYSGGLSNVAIVDLTNYSVFSIALPDGYFDSQNLASAMPDGKTIVAVDQENSDAMVHVLLISTATNTISGDYAQPYAYLPEASALAITPNGMDPSKFFGYLAGGDSQSNVIMALDLRPNSPTYGSVLPQTRIYATFVPSALAVNSDGTRVMMAGTPNPPPNVNTYVIDAAKMLTDPANAVIAQLQVSGGLGASAVSTGFFATTPPDTAPVVGGVSGDITNDADHEIEITGGNFQQGALVRIGSMAPLPSTFLGSDKLSVTVPVNAPAGEAVDVIVTNPERQAPLDQQNQSGLLTGQFSILLNPMFQPATQFSTINYDGSFSVYDLGQRQMINIPAAQSLDNLQWSVFNVDGKQLYFAGDVAFYNGFDRVVVPADLNTNSLGDAITLSGSHQLSSNNIAASIDPNTGKPVVNAVTRASSHLLVGVIDSDSNSPTFNTIVRTFDSGNVGSGAFPYGIATTPDGKFAYIWYRAGYPYRYYLGIMNLSTGAFTQVSATDLRVVQPNLNNGVKPVITPDGQYLLLSSTYGSRTRIEVIDISKRTMPNRLVELVPVPVPGHGFPVVTNYQVVGDRLYAFDPNGIIVIFRFQPQTGDFRKLGWYICPINTYLSSATQFAPNFGFSPDGRWLYASDPVNDLIAVLDPAKLAGGKDAVVTTIRASYGPFRLAVSPVPPPNRLATIVRRGGIEKGLVAGSHHSSKSK